MSGFIIESLYHSGWRRSSQVYWRYQDAIREAESQLAEDEASAVRVLAIRVEETPFFQSERPEASDAKGK
jgi:hypothetical protein